MAVSVAQNFARWDDTVGGDLAIGGAATVGGTLTVTGALLGSSTVTSTSTLTASAALVAAGTVARTGDISPAALGAGSTDNYAPTGLSTASRLRATPVATSVLTGITGGADGRELWLDNISATESLQLNHDATSTATNRFFLPNNANLTMLPNTSVLLVYDATLASGRWRVLA